MSTDMDVTERPLAPGDDLHGYCGGYLGRDHYYCSVVEAAGPDWIVARESDGRRLDFASGDALIQLRQYRQLPDGDWEPICQHASTATCDNRQA